MRTLSIRQPWAWLIVRPDLTDATARAAALQAGLVKTIENRDWSTSYRGPVLLHASVTLTQKYLREVAEQLAVEFGDQAPALPPHDRLQRGGIVGVAEIVDCVDAHDSRWFTGPFGFVLRHIRPLPFVPWKGQLSFFDVPRSAVNLQEHSS